MDEETRAGFADMRRGFAEVNRRFDQVDQRFDGVDQNEVIVGGAFRQIRRDLDELRER